MKTIFQFSYKFDRPPSVPQVDCRTIPNPYSPHAHLTPEQYDTKVRSWPQFDEAVQKGMRLFMTNDTIAVGCTFGRHRSVIVAEEIAKRSGAAIVYRSKTKTAA